MNYPFEFSRYHNSVRKILIACVHRYEVEGGVSFEFCIFKAHVPPTLRHILLLCDIQTSFVSWILFVQYMESLSPPLVRDYSSILGLL